jgi:hypothetical protein
MGVGGYPNIGAQFTAASSQYATIADNTSLSTGDIDFTLACWAWTDTTGTAKFLIGKSGVAGNREFFLQFGTTNIFTFGVYYDGTSFASRTGATFGSLALSTWAYCVCWHDSVANTLNVQVNDGAVDSVGHALGGFDSTAAVQLGANNGAASFHQGRLDTPAMWKRVLTTAERTRLYNNGTGLAYRDLDAELKTSLISWWDLDGNWSDCHGTNHLTPTNGPTFVAGKR